MKKMWKKAVGLCLALAVTLTAMPAVFADMEMAETAEPVFSAEEMTNAETEAYAEPVSREQVDQMVSDFIANYDGELTEQDLADLEEFRLRRGDEVEQEAALAESASVAETDDNTYEERYPNDITRYATGELKLQTTISGYIKKDGRSYDDTTYWHGYVSLCKVNGRRDDLIEKQDTGNTGAFSFEINSENGLEEGLYRLVMTDELLTLVRKVDIYVYQTRFVNEIQIGTYEKPVFLAVGDLDQNGKIMDSDFNTFQSEYLGRYDITPDSPYAPYDFNGDGVINMTDMMMLNQRMSMTTAKYPKVWGGSGSVVSVEDPTGTFGIEVSEGTTEEDVKAILPQEFSVIFDGTGALVGEDEYEPIIRTLPVEFWIGEAGWKTNGTHKFYGVISLGYDDTDWMGEPCTSYYKNDHFVPVVVTVDVIVEPIGEYIPQIVAGKDFVLGLADDGTIYGQGKLAPTGRNSYITVDDTVAEWNALTGDGRVETLYATKLNMAGLTGDGHVKANGSIARTGTNKSVIESWENVEQVAMSDVVLAARFNDGTIAAVSDGSAYGVKIVDEITKWSSCGKLAVGNSHAIAINQFNEHYAAGYHANDNTDIEPEELNILPWISSNTLLDIQVGDGYTVGLDSNYRLQAAGKYDAGSGGGSIIIPSDLKRTNITKIRAYDQYVFAITSDKKYTFLDTKKIQNDTYEPDVSLLYDHDAGAGSGAWTDLVDIALSKETQFLIGLCKDGSILYRLPDKYTFVTADVISSWNLGETVEE